MMKLIAWDTSSKSGALVAAEWDENSSAPQQGLRLAAEWSLSVDAQHSERLLWGVHELLEACHWKLSDVDVFAAGVGPGSFTGLRIGLTTARTLAHTLKKPLIGVSSLAALARPAAQWLSAASKKALVIAASDASKGELYCLFGPARAVSDCVAMAQGDVPGLWKGGVEERIVSPEELSTVLVKKARALGAWIAVGEGRTRYPDAWKKFPARMELHPPGLFSHLVQGRTLATLAWEAYQAGLAKDPLSVTPRYVRAPDAELKLRKGLLPPGPTRGNTSGTAE